MSHTPPASDAVPLAETITAWFAAQIDTITEANSWKYELTAIRPKTSYFDETICKDGDVIVTTGRETVINKTLDTNGMRICQMEIFCEVFATGSERSDTTIETKLNYMAGQVITLVLQEHADGNPCGGYAEHVDLVGSEFADGMTISSKTLQFLVTYATAWADPYTQKT